MQCVKDLHKSKQTVNFLNSVRSNIDFEHTGTNKAFFKFSLSKCQQSFTISFVLNAYYA